ncbi:MAG: glutamine--tRNA ligase [Gammaproteobacteria bacterium]|nr:glutamine--tRNA ligase [Gammaproteobacteria bacterium]
MSSTENNNPSDVATRSFIEADVAEDIRAQRYSRPICTRFPPEPNGYWHLGHVLAITINHSTAKAFQGQFKLRFDDTNPIREKQEFVDAALEDLAWLGIQPDVAPIYASDFFEALYQIAERLVMSGDAYVCDLSPDEAKELRGDYHRPGQPSPYRDRSCEENLSLLRAMRRGEFKPGEKSLRARIEVNSPNMNLRDPVLLRILHEAHYRQGSRWTIYPSYDFAQSFNDALDGVTHSLCSSEFISHRPLYDWLLEKACIEEPPRQIEFGKIQLEGTVLGKRHIRSLIENSVLSGWDDPRLLTVRGMRRRGFPSTAIVTFCRQVGVSKHNRSVNARQLEQTVRDELNRNAHRRMAVIKPLRLVLENLPKGEVLTATVRNNPIDPSAGERRIQMGRELYIERDDFMCDPPRKYNRLAPGKEVRLRGSVVIKCTGYETDPYTHAITCVRATYDADTLGKNPADGRKVRGVIHWVSADHGINITVNFYQPLLLESGELNPESHSAASALAEPGVETLPAETCVQFERIGYFAIEARADTPTPVFNQTVTLRDSWNLKK